MKKTEQMYQDYLKRVGLEEGKMSCVQSVETRRAFMAGVASTMVWLENEVSEKEEEEGMEALTGMKEECEQFWLNETN